MECGNDQLIGGKGQGESGKNRQPAASEPALHAVLGKLFLAVVGGDAVCGHGAPLT